ncbi:MAG: response regulator [Planctomycetota bacterium]
MASKKQILVVDDDNHVREILRLFLERHGYRISEAPNGYEAVEACRSNKFDLVIADIYMPGMDGIKFIEALHKFSPETKVVAISGGEPCHFFTSSTQLNAALYKGALLTLAKPIKEGELVSIVKKFIGESAKPGPDNDA